MMGNIYSYPTGKILFCDTKEALSAWAGFLRENPDFDILQDPTSAIEKFEKLNNCKIVTSYNRVPWHIEFLTDEDRLAFFLRYGAE